MRLSFLPALWEAQGGRESWRAVGVRLARGTWLSVQCSVADAVRDVGK